MQKVNIDVYIWNSYGLMTDWGLKRTTYDRSFERMRDKNYF